MRSLARRVLEQICPRAADWCLAPLRRSRPGDDPYHRHFAEFVAMVAAHPQPAVLELGSRSVRGFEGRARFPGVSDYTGIDVHPGVGVDVVADVHRLSTVFPTKRFDFVYSISVFEHLMFPWKAVLEINAVLRPGGHVFVATHPTWPAHELPWDFFRFLHHSAISLFNAATGFELVTVSEGLPARVVSLVRDEATRGNCLSPTHQGIAIIARKFGDYDRERLRWDVLPADVSDTMYPKPD